MISISSWKLRIKSNINTQPLWLDKMYFASKPLVNLQRELNAPVPNFFVVKCGALSQEFPLSAWDQILTVGAGLVNNKTLFIEWIYRTSQGSSKVGVSAIPIYNVVFSTGFTGGSNFVTPPAPTPAPTPAPSPGGGDSGGGY